MENGERGYTKAVAYLEEKFDGNERYLLRLQREGRFNDVINIRIKRRTKGFERKLLRAVNCY